MNTIRLSQHEKRHDEDVKTSRLLHFYMEVHGDVRKERLKLQSSTIISSHLHLPASNLLILH